MNLTAIDLFAGPGGTSVGFSRAGFEVRAAVEADPLAAGSYAKNHKDTELLTEDIRDVSSDQLLEAAGLAAGECTAVIGCPPCQGFSTHRLRNAGAGDPRNQLVVVFASLVAATHPLFFVFENVPGMLRAADSPWDEASRILEEAGYRIRKRILNAADYGVGQRRLRLTAVGCRDESIVFDVPSPTHCDPRQHNDLPPWRTVKDEIEDLPRLGNGEHCTTDPLHYASKHTDDSLQRFAAIPKDGGSRKSLPSDLALKCHTAHQGHRDVYGRLWWDKPAGTITGGCTQPSKGRFLHPDQDRGISLREAARLQSFDDDYGFEGSKHEIALQIGNAVPPRLALAIANSIKAAIAESTIAAPSADAPAEPVRI